MTWAHLDQRPMVTPRHAVRMKWNSMTTLSKTRGLGLTHKLPSFDTVQERQLHLEEKVVLATKLKGGSRYKQHRHGGLSMK